MYKFVRFLVLLVFFSVLLAACALQPADLSGSVPPVDNSPYSIQPGDSLMMRGDVQIVSASILAAESFPPQYSLSLLYRMITPCYKLRVTISQPDSQKRIHLEIFGVAPKDKPCNLMALSTPQQASIQLGSLPSGHYTVWVNGVQVGVLSI